MELRAKSIDEVCRQLWRKINIYTARKHLSSRVKDFQCPQCENGLLKINWNKKGMSYSCLDKNCNFEYPN